MSGVTTSGSSTDALINAVAVEEQFLDSWLCVCGCRADEHFPYPSEKESGGCHGCPRCRVYFPAGADEIRNWRRMWWEARNVGQKRRRSR